MEKIGKFELHAKLGEGGFGRVWKALDTDLGVWRALKEPFDQSDEMEKELKEARIQAVLDHPGIVRVLAIERIDGRFLMVMEFADGPNLRHVIKERVKERGKMEVAEADNILRGILEALQYAHSKGVAHLDLKPENVFCTTDGRFKLGDFGLARISDCAMSTLTSTQGTICYMSPEQLDGKAGTISDMWALGAIAYELYVGKLALPGNTQAEVLKNLAIGTVRDFGEVPEERRDFVASLLTHNPMERCPDARTALAMLGGEPFDPLATRAIGDEMLTVAIGKDTPAGKVDGKKGGAPRNMPGMLAVIASSIVMLAVVLGSIGHATWYNILENEIVEGFFLGSEEEMDMERPDAEFFGADHTTKMKMAWDYASGEQFRKAIGACQEILASEAPDDVMEEAHFFRGSVQARYMETPLHAAHSLRTQLDKYPDGKLANRARLLLAEAYIEVGRIAEALYILDVAVREGAGDNVTSEALALLEMAENYHVAASGLGSLIFPNNGTSLFLALASFLLLLCAALLFTGNFKVRMVMVSVALLLFATQLFMNSSASRAAGSQWKQVMEKMTP